jgi:hypothetical protein
MSQHSHCDHCQKEQVAQPILIKHEQRWVGEFCCWECAGEWVSGQFRPNTGTKPLMLCGSLSDFGITCDLHGCHKGLHRNGEGLNEVQWT